MFQMLFVCRSQTILRLAIFALALGCAPLTNATDLSGCWSGSWKSCGTGHKGPLNATFTKCGETQYHVAFSGRFFKIMPFRYSVTLDVIEDGDTVKLSGSSFLGRIMGTFSYSATATACTFDSAYSSCKDNGWFHLTKCGG